MEVLHVIEQQCTLHKSYNSLIIRKNGRKIMDVPLIHMETIIIYGYNQISTQLIHQLADLGINIHFVGLSGRTKALVISNKSNNVILRMAQYKVWQEEKKAILIGKKIVYSKIMGQYNNLIRHRKKIIIDDWKKYKSKINTSLEKLNQCKSINQLFGIEGTCAKEYFALFNNCLTKHTFVKRDRRPAHDIVNALLNLSYMTTLSMILSNLISLGFDTEIGIIHGIRYGRESLALDLLECFRPVLDHFVIKLLNQNNISKDYYTIDAENGCRLTIEGIKYFMNYYEENFGQEGKLINLKKEDIRQQKNLRKYILGEVKEFKPYIYK